MSYLQNSSSHHDQSTFGRKFINFSVTRYEIGCRAIKKDVPKINFGNFKSYYFIKDYKRGFKMLKMPRTAIEIQTPVEQGCCFIEGALYMVFTPALKGFRLLKFQI